MSDHVCRAVSITGVGREGAGLQRHFYYAVAVTAASGRRLTIHRRYRQFHALKGLIGSALDAPLGFLNPTDRDALHRGAAAWSRPTRAFPRKTLPTAAAPLAGGRLGPSARSLDERRRLLEVRTAATTPVLCCAVLCSDVLCCALLCCAALLPVLLPVLCYCLCYPPSPCHPLSPVD